MTNATMLLPGEKEEGGAGNENNYWWTLGFCDNENIFKK